MPQESSCSNPKFLLCGTSESITNILGTKTTPLVLQVDIDNKTNQVFRIDSICISIKHNYFLFSTSKDVLKQSKQYSINPKSTFSFKLDVRQLLNKYSTDKKFKVKIESNNEVYESDIVHLGALKVFNDKKDLI